MMIKKLLRSITLIIASIALFTAPLALADANSQIFGACNNSVSGSSVCKNQNTKNNPIVDKIKIAVDIVAVIAGVAAVIMIIISGLMFITAGGTTPGQRSGDPNRIKSAKQTLTNALIGLLIIALAWAITRFVVDVIL